MSTVPPRMRGSVAIAVVFLGVGGCAVSATHAEPSPSARPAWPPARSWPALTACGNYERGFSRVPLPNPAAPVYAGAGPHRAVVGEYIGPQAKGMVHIKPSTFSLPTSWRALNAKGTQPDPSHAELIVCLSQVERQPGTRIGRCTYDKAKVDVYPADYTFDVYAARTGMRVAQLTISGDESAPASCPPSVLTRGNERFPVAQGISPAALHSRLRPLITARIP